MKKIISSIVAMFALVIAFTSIYASVSVKVLTDNIPAGTYIIGTHAFDRNTNNVYNGTLTVKHIMLAAKTISGNTINDMEVYYKRAIDGAWVDAITTEVVEMPEKTTIQYYNTEAIESISDLEALEMPHVEIVHNVLSVKDAIRDGENGQIYTLELAAWNCDEYELQYRLMDETEYTKMDNIEAVIDENNRSIIEFFVPYVVEEEIEFPYIKIRGVKNTDTGAVKYSEYYETTLDYINPSIVVENSTENEEQVNVIVKQLKPLNLGWTMELYVSKDLGQTYNLVEFTSWDTSSDSFERTFTYLFEPEAYANYWFKAVYTTKSSCGTYTFTTESQVVKYESNKTNFGDVNEDGEIDIGDALLVQSYTEENTTLTDTQLKKADVNGDGYVDKVDAHLITGFDAGYFPNTLPNTQITDYILYGDVLNSGDLYELESPAAYSAIEQYLNVNTSYLEGQALKNADVNGDGEVNHIDKCIIYGYINGYINGDNFGVVLPSFKPITVYFLYGDIDNDGIVDSDDAYLLEDYLNELDTLDEQGMKNADMNGDGVVNDDDYPILIQHLVTGTKLPFYAPKENVTKIEYYVFDELEANEYLISVPDGVDIEWNGEYQFADNSVLYDIDLFKLPNDFNELERFKGWYTDKEGTTKFDTTQTLTGTTKLYAIFDMEFTVVYNGNGATSGMMENSVFTIGETTNLSKNTYTKEGYKFVGWTEDLEDGSVKYTDEGEIQIPLYYLSEAKTPYVVYAVWEKEVVLGDVNEDGEINGMDATAVLGYAEGSTTLTEKQKTAADVNLDEDIDEIDVKIILKKAADLIQTLPYDSGNKYTLTCNLNGGETFLPIDKVYAEISLPMTLQTPTKEGYVFTGWTGSNGDTPETTVTIEEGTTGDLEYTANWELAE